MILLITVLIRTVLIYIILIAVMRMLGKRQIGELELSELVITIMLSELAVTPIMDINIPLLHTIVPIAVLVSLEVIFTYAETKNTIFKKMLSDEPSILINRGVIDQNELSKVRLTVEELLSELRLKDISDVSTVYYAILEKNGQLSVFPRSDPENGIMHPLVIDGFVLRDNIAQTGRSEAWLLKQLEKHDTELSETFLFSVDDSGKTFHVKKVKKNNARK